MSGNMRPSKSPPQNNLHVCEASAEKNRRSRHSMPTLSSTPSASHRSSSAANREYLAQETPHLSTTGTDHSTDFGSVSLDPPITQAVLSEIDIPRLKNNLVFRHHLNFGFRIVFRLQTRGLYAEERREQALEYWRAMATEIALWLAHCQSIAACPSSQHLCMSLLRRRAGDVHQRTALRLPRLFGAIRDILKHSLPCQQWPAIDAWLDVRFLMQQLEHGVCDFTALSDWLGNFLRRFCSPRLRCLLHTMTSAIRFGVENAETESIVHGLRTILDILQEMKLDATNHSIRKLHLAWVEDSIAFEQNDFLRQISDGLDITGAQIWFKNLQEADEESGSGLWILVRPLTDAVRFCHKYFAPTWILDCNRLRTLQLDFQALVYQAACRKTLDQTLRFLCWTDKVLQTSYTDLFRKVAVLISGKGLRYDYSPRRENVALEVVRAAYAICRIHEVPTSKDLNFANGCLRHCCDPKERVFEELRRSLAMDLDDRVDDEVCAIGDLTPVQLMRCLLPRNPWFAVQSETEGLVHIAKRISHMAELHWRIWGPILYEQPLRVGGRASGHASPIEEGLNGQGSSSSRTTDESGGLPRNTDLD